MGSQHGQQPSHRPPVARDQPALSSGAPAAVAECCPRAPSLPGGLLGGATGFARRVAELAFQLLASTTGLGARTSGCLPRLPLGVALELLGLTFDSLRTIAQVCSVPGAVDGRGSVLPGDLPVHATGRRHTGCAQYRAAVRAAPLWVGPVGSG
jgi:hypothetical protein